MKKVYVINCYDCSEGFNFRELEANKNYEAIMNEAERLGTVYSIKGFQDAVNNDDINLSDSFIYIGE